MHWPNLGASPPCAWKAHRYLDRLVQVARFDEKIATQLLLGLVKRTVRRERRAIPDPYGRRRRCRLEGIASEQMPAPLDRVKEVFAFTRNGVPRIPPKCAEEVKNFLCRFRCRLSPFGFPE